MFAGTTGITLQKPGDAGTVCVSDLSVPAKYVVARGLSFEFPEDLLHRFFGRYGHILHCRAIGINAGLLKGVLSGMHTLTMKLLTDVPSSMWLLGFQF